MTPSKQQIIGRLREAQAKDLLKRGFKVQARARILLSGGAGHPKRVDTGLLRSSIQVNLVSTAKPKVRIGTNRKYARWVHDGTGIYGPRRVPITPKRGKVLVFKSKAFGGPKGKVFARSVKGMRKNQFLKDAMPAAKLP